MNRSQGSQIAAENVTKGMTLWCRTRTLGQALVKVLSDEGTQGWRVEIAQGFLQSPADRKKRWVVGQTVLLPSASVEKWYQLAEV